MFEKHQPQLARFGEVPCLTEIEIEHGRVFQHRRAGAPLPALIFDRKAFLQPRHQLVGSKPIEHVQLCVASDSSRQASDLPTMIVSTTGQIGGPIAADIDLINVASWPGQSHNAGPLKREAEVLPGRILGHHRIQPQQRPSQVPQTANQTIQDRLRIRGGIDQKRSGRRPAVARQHADSHRSRSPAEQRQGGRQFALAAYDHSA